MVAVFAALVLAWACFVACSNSSSDSGSNGADDSSSNSGSDSGSNSGSTTISVQALQGLWIEKEQGQGGIYVVNEKYYLVEVEGNNYSYTEKEGMAFSVDGNKLITHYEDEEDDVVEFAIKGNELSLTYVAEEGANKGKPVTDKYTKSSATPTKK